MSARRRGAGLRREESAALCKSTPKTASPAPCFLTSGTYGARPPRCGAARSHRGPPYCLWATFISTLQWKPVTFCASLKCITHLDAVRSGKFIGRFLQTIALRFALPAIPNNQCTGTCRSSAGFSRLSRPGRSIAFLVNFESGGAGFLPQGASPPNRSIGVREKIARNSGKFGICLAGMRPRCSWRRLLRCDKPETL